MYLCLCSALHGKEVAAIGVTDFLDLQKKIDAQQIELLREVRELRLQLHRVESRLLDAVEYHHPLIPSDISELASSADDACNPPLQPEITGDQKK